MKEEIATRRLCDTTKDIRVSFNKTQQLVTTNELFDGVAALQHFVELLARLGRNSGCAPFRGVGLLPVAGIYAVKSNFRNNKIFNAKLQTRSKVGVLLLCRITQCAAFLK